MGDGKSTKIQSTNILPSAVLPSAENKVVEASTTSTFPGGRGYTSNTVASNPDSSIGDYFSRRETYRKEMDELIRDLLSPSKLHSQQHGLSMLSRQMLEGLVKQVEAVVDAKIDGDVYEFGSWRGGASILMARAFEAYEKLIEKEEHHHFHRTFWVFDTFDGFSNNQVGNDTLLQDLLLDDYWVAPLDKVQQSFVSFTSEEFETCTNRPKSCWTICIPLWSRAATSLSMTTIGGQKSGPRRTNTTSKFKEKYARMRWTTFGHNTTSPRRSRGNTAVRRG